MRSTVERRSLARRAIPWLAVAALLLALTQPVARAESEADELAAPEPLEGLMVKLRNLIANASAKLKSNLRGVGMSGAGSAPTPARMCCLGNLNLIRQRMDDLEQELDRFGACYDESGQSPATVALEFAKIDLQGLAAAVDNFDAAPTRGQAFAGHQAMTRAYLLLRKTMAELPPCPPPDESKKGGARKGKRDKK